jgi:hypothetical protein
VDGSPDRVARSSATALGYFENNVQQMRCTCPSRVRKRTQIIRFGVASRGHLDSLVAEHIRRLLVAKRRAPLITQRRQVMIQSPQRVAGEDLAQAGAVLAPRHRRLPGHERPRPHARISSAIEKHRKRRKSSVDRISFSEPSCRSGRAPDGRRLVHAGLLPCQGWLVVPSEPSSAGGFGVAGCHGAFTPRSVRMACTI